MHAQTGLRQKLGFGDELFLAQPQAGSSFRPCGSRFPAADSQLAPAVEDGAYAGAALVRQTDAAEGIDDAGVANLLVTGIEQLLARGEGVARD